MGSVIATVRGVAVRVGFCGINVESVHCLLIFYSVMYHAIRSIPKVLVSQTLNLNFKYDT